MLPTGSQNTRNKVMNETEKAYLVLSKENAALKKSLTAAEERVKVAEGIIEKVAGGHCYYSKGVPKTAFTDIGFGTKETAKAFLTPTTPEVGAEEEMALVKREDLELVLGMPISEHYEGHTDEWAARDRLKAALDKP
jgi:hypothetical protein